MKRPCNCRGEFCQSSTIVSSLKRVAYGSPRSPNAAELHYRAYALAYTRAYRFQNDDAVNGIQPDTSMPVASRNALRSAPSRVNRRIFNSSPCRRETTEGYASAGVTFENVQGAALSQLCFVLRTRIQNGPRNQPNSTAVARVPQERRPSRESSRIVEKYFRST